MGQGVGDIAPGSVLNRCREIPFSAPNCLEVFIHHPSLPFSGMSFPAPGKDRFPEIMVEGRENLGTIDEPVIVSPSSQNWIERVNDNLWQMRGIGFEPFSDALEEVLDLT